MKNTTIQCSSGITKVYLDADIGLLKEIAPTENSFIITDENLMMHYEAKFKPWKTIIIPPGEASKNLETIDDVVRQLVALETDRGATVIGIGGGVVTDLAGFAASIFKRGIRFGFVPTSLLGMIDASIGGKNGVDIGEYKNMIGLIKQPDFLLYNYEILKTLPEDEWVNGFAEIIKHACISDAGLFSILEAHTLSDFKQDSTLLQQVIERNIAIKSNIVQQDETEQGNRKLLNFGHTFGHAIEKTHQISHGQAVAIGMMMAAKISEKLVGFQGAARLKKLITQYGLPVSIAYSPQQVSMLMAADKKRFSNDINYILLTEIGNAVVQKIPVKDLTALIANIDL